MRNYPFFYHIQSKTNGSWETHSIQIEYKYAKIIKGLLLKRCDKVRIKRRLV